MQNSACTAFTLFLCELLSADLCIADVAPGDPDYWVSHYNLSHYNQTVPFNFETIAHHWISIINASRYSSTIVVKLTTTSYGTQATAYDRINDLIEWTDHIYWFRNPLATYSSLDHKFFRNEGGSLEQKLAFADEDFYNNCCQSNSGRYTACINDQILIKPAALEVWLHTRGFPTDVARGLQLSQTAAGQGMGWRTSPKKSLIIGNFHPPLQFSRMSHVINTTIHLRQLVEQLAPHMMSSYHAKAQTQISLDCQAFLGRP